jgi:hypothetical protein
MLVLLTVVGVFPSESLLLYDLHLIWTEVQKIRVDRLHKTVDKCISVKGFSQPLVERRPPGMSQTAVRACREGV